MMTYSRLRAIVVTSLGSLLLAACGGDDTPTQRRRRARFFHCHLLPKVGAERRKPGLIRRTGSTFDVRLRLRDPLAILVDQVQSIPGVTSAPDSIVPSRNTWGSKEQPQSKGRAQVWCRRCWIQDDSQALPLLSWRMP